MKQQFVCMCFLQHVGLTVDFCVSLFLLFT